MDLVFHHPSQVIDEGRFLGGVGVEHARFIGGVEDVLRAIAAHHLKGLLTAYSLRRSLLELQEELLSLLISLRGSKEVLRRRAPFVEVG